MKKKTQFECLYCEPPMFIDKDDFDEHMFHHQRRGDDLGTIKIPDKWDDFVRRFMPMGLCTLREVDESVKPDNEKQLTPEQQKQISEWYDSLIELSKKKK